MSEFKLRPCPFCGADLTRDPNGTAHHRHPDTPCFFAPFAILSGTPEEVEAWNRRAPDPEFVELKAAWADVWTATNDQAAVAKLNRLSDAIKSVCGVGRTNVEKGEG